MTQEQFRTADAEQGGSALGHVLVVDDHRDCAESLALLIGMEGFTVATAGSLSEAWMQFRNHRPQLVILDMNLPDGRGIEFLQQTRHIADLHIVMQSGSSDQKDDLQARQLGALDYLVKPTDLGRLKAILGQVAA